MKKSLKFFIRLLITSFLLFFLFKKLNFSEVYQILKKSNLLYFVSASFLYILSSYVSTLRWRVFISSSEIKISELFSFYLIGSFFNTVLPGIISGDVVKILIVKDKINLKEAIFSVFMDRYIGFAALVLIGFISFVVFYNRLPKNWIIWSVPLAFFSFILISVLLYRLVNFRFLKDFKVFLVSLRKNQIFKAFFLSLIVQLCVILSVYMIAVCVDVKLSIFKIFIFLPVIVLITTLPISISGIGLREWCFIIFFSSSISDQQAVAVSFVWFVSVVFASLVGGFEYLRLKEFLNVKQK